MFQETPAGQKLKKEGADVKHLQRAGVKMSEGVTTESDLKLSKNNLTCEDAGALAVLCS